MKMSLKKFATQIEEEVLEDLRLYAKSSKKSISGLVSEAVADYLQKVKVRSAFTNAMDEVLNENEELLKRLAQ